MNLDSMSFIEIVQALESGELTDDDIPDWMWNELGTAVMERTAECKGENP